MPTFRGNYERVPRRLHRGKESDKVSHTLSGQCTSTLISGFNSSCTWLTPLSFSLSSLSELIRHWPYFLKLYLSDYHLLHLIVKHLKENQYDTDVISTVDNFSHQQDVSFFNNLFYVLKRWWKTTCAELKRDLYWKNEIHVFTSYESFYVSLWMF